MKLLPPHRLAGFVASLFVAAVTARASTVQLPQTTYTVPENAGSVSVAVSVSRDTADRGSNEVIQVDYTTMDGPSNGPDSPATHPNDYSATSGTLTFSAGVTSLSVSIPIVNHPGDNGWTSGKADFSFKISGPRSNSATQPTISGSDTATITIQDVDGNRIGFTTTDYQVDEPDPGQARTVRLVVKRYGSNSQAATIQYQTNDGTAKSGTDYFGQSSAQSGALTFPNNSPDKAGEDASTQFIDITVLNDGAASGNKTFTVQLSGDFGGSAQGDTTATVTIVDQETTTVRFSSANYSVSENAGKVTLAVVRNGNLNVTGTVQLMTADGSGAGAAHAGTNYSATSASLSFAAGESVKTVDIPIFNDNAVRGTLQFIANLTKLAGGNASFILGEPSSATVSIIDAAPANTVEFAQADNSVARGTGAARILVRLNRGSGDDTVSVHYATSNTSDSQQTAVPNVDYTPVSGDLTFGPGESLKYFDVPILDSGASETRKLVLNLSNPSSNAFLGVSTALLTIIPANSAGTVQFSSPQYSVQENNGAVTLTLLLNRIGDSSRTVTVDYTTSPGSAASSRFVPSSGRVTFANGASVATISIGVINDSVVQPDPQTFFVTLSNPANASLGSTDTATVSILDDDGLNTVEFDAPQYGAVETSGKVDVQVRAIRGGDPNQVLKVDIALGAQGDTAMKPGDYQNPSSTTLTFPAGVSVQSVAIPITNNPAAQGVKTFTVSLTNPGAFTQVGRQNSARVTIFDNSGPNTAQFLTSAYHFREGDQRAIAIPVVRFGDFDVNGTNVNYTTEVRSGDTAQDGVNFTATSGTLFFAPLVQKDPDTKQNVVVDNEHQHSIIIPIPNNTLVQGDVTFHVTLISSDVAQLGSISTVEITINDDDLGNVVQFSSSTYSVSEANGNAILTVNLIPSGDASKASSVDYVATPITAYAGFDFAPVSGTLTFAPGETSKTILVPINNDTIPEGSETFRVTLSNPSPGTIIGTPSNAVVTIVDDDITSAVQFSPASYTVAENGGSVTLDVIANRQGSPNSVLTVQYQTVGGTATEGADYGGASGVLTFNAGETQKTITIQILDDNLIESTESFSVVLSNPNGAASLGTSSTATVNISDDDSPTATIGFDKPFYNVDEGAGFANLMVTRSGGLGVSATVNYATADGTAKAGTNYAATSGSITFNVGQVSQIIQIPIIDDTTADPTLNFTVTLTAADGTGFIGGQATATVNILDNDVTVFRFNPADYVVDEGAGTVTLTVEALRVGDPAEVITVDYLTNDGSATAGSRYERTSGRLTFDAGVTKQSFTVPIIDNNVADGTEFFVVNLSNPQSSDSKSKNPPTLGTPSMATVTIVDNDATTFQFSAASYSVDNAAGNATATVTLSRLASANDTYTVDYTTSDLSATSGQDYTATSGTLTFAPGETSKTISIPLIAEARGTPTRQFAITLSNPSPGTVLGQISQAVVTVTNFDFSTKLLNISTRGPVATGNDAMIAGFIVQGGSSNKELIIRGLGPSLMQYGVNDAMSDPSLSVFDANGSLIAFNEDFGDNSTGDKAELATNQLTPTNPKEAALVVFAEPGSYTAVLNGKTNGIGLVEVYDVNATGGAKAVNISTRGKVGEGDTGALIAGFIVGAPANQPGVTQHVVIRAIGPSLKSAGVSTALSDTTLDLYRGSQLILSNDDWTKNSTSDQKLLKSLGIAPTSTKESAIVTNLDPGSYSAVIRGKNNGTGVALAEVYQLNQ